MMCLIYLRCSYFVLKTILRPWYSFLLRLFVRSLCFALSSKKDSLCADIIEDMARKKSDRRTSIDDKYPVSIIDLHVPCPRRMVGFLQQGLRLLFQDVTVEWTDCPDLRKFDLVAPGLCGNPAILEIGSLSYLFSQPRPEKTYYFKDILSQLNLLDQENFIIGAGKHSAPPYYNHGQLIANLKFSQRDPAARKIQLYNRSMASWSFMSDTIYMQKVWETNPTCAIQGNFFLSQGKPGKILKVMVRHRTGPLSFVSAIQAFLDNMRTKEDVGIFGLGGMFMVDGMPTLHHIMPACSNGNYYTMDQVYKWLKYTKVAGPVTAVGTIMNHGGYYSNNCSTSPNIPYITKSHFHSFNLSTEEGGHYCGDYSDSSLSFINNYNGSYTGYFSFAEKLYVIDPSPYAMLKTFNPPCKENVFKVINVFKTFTFP